jgi:hypothetical protein
MVYNSVLWLALLVNIKAAKLVFVALIVYLVLISGITSGQGDRVMMTALPLVIYLVTMKRKSGHGLHG